MVFGVILDGMTREDEQEDDERWLALEQQRVGTAGVQSVAVADSKLCSCPWTPSYSTVDLRSPVLAYSVAVPVVRETE